MSERHEKSGADRRTTDRRKCGNRARGPLFDSSIPRNVMTCQPVPPRDRGLLDTLERARAGYWLAVDRHDPSAADAHAAHYRAALRRAYLGPSLDALTRRLERESAALCQAMLEQEARIATLERELLGEGGVL